MHPCSFAIEAIPNVAIIIIFFSVCVKYLGASQMFVGVWLVLKRVCEAYSFESLYSDG
jgi:hypothetical protein